VLLVRSNATAHLTCTEETQFNNKQRKSMYTVKYTVSQKKCTKFETV